MHLGQHREDRLVLNVFLNLLSSSLNCMEVEVLGMVYNWKCTCFPSRSLWASSWFYLCPGQQFSDLSTLSWLFLTNGNICVHAFPAVTCLPDLESSARWSWYWTHYPGVTPNTAHHSFQEAFLVMSLAKLCRFLLSPCLPFQRHKAMHVLACPYPEQFTT